MATELQRIQALLDPATFERVQKLMTNRRASMSSITTELIRAALDLAEYADELASIPTQEPQEKKYVTKDELKAEFVQSAVEGADLDSEMLQKLLKLSEVLDAE